MDFYKMLAEHYDDIFEEIGDEVGFLTEHAPDKGSRILDVACGTGQHAEALYKLGYKNIEAIDLEPESIMRAKAKLSEINFISGSMTDLKAFYPGNFNMIYCIGNSIAHLNSTEELGIFLSDVFSLLSESGSLILQCVNYDRIYKGRVTELPLIQKNGLSFKRVYELGPEKVRFTGILKTEEAESFSITELLAIRSGMLRQALSGAGFRNTLFYGDFLKTPYSSESSYSLVTWSKKD